jgi:hypothetical protein
MKPIITSEFEWPVGVKHRFEFYDIYGQELPDLPWQQVYAICNIGGKIILPVYQDEAGGLHTGTNLIGGHSEAGETAEETLRREVLEETNCEVLKWLPLGYQKVWDMPDGVVYQLRVYAEVKELGPFISDLGGKTHVDNVLVDLKDINNYLKWGEAGEFLIEKAEGIIKPTR